MTATKVRVSREAARHGFRFEADGDSVWLACPEGFEFVNQEHGVSYTEWPVGPGEDYSKSECYRWCLDIIAQGMARRD